MSAVAVAQSLEPVAPGPAPGQAPSQVPQQVMVRAVLVEGNKRVEVDAVKAVITQKAGEPFDARKVRSDIQKVMKLGFFADVVVERRGDAAAFDLIYRVVEKPAVRETKVEGNEELNKDDFKDLIAEIKPYSILDVQGIRKTAKKIQEKYVEKGFYLAEVTHRLEPQPDNQVTVVFVVNEHAKVEVKEINFLGNEHIPAKDLTAVMQTQEGGFLSFLTSAGTYREEAFQRDLQAIQAVYKDKGYINVRVGRPAIALSPDKRYLYIAIRIEEGDQFRMGKLDFSGELLTHGKDELAKKFRLKNQDIFAVSVLGQDMFAIADVYRDDGYAYANVTPLTDIDAKNRIVNLTLDIQPGQKTYFERVEITGNSKTRDKVIRRELRIFEGELFSGTGLKVSKQRVTALGYFETVEITTKKGSADDKIVATVEVKEKPTGTFQVGAGFSSYESFILTAQIAQNNFLGWGQQVSLGIQWSSIRQLIQFQFVEPYFLDTKWTFAFDAYSTESRLDIYTREALGGSVTWGYELNGLEDWWPWAKNLEDVRVFGTYTNEYVKTILNDNGPQVLLANRFRSGTTSATRLTLQWDKRDNRLFPTSGFFQALSAEAAPPFLAPSAVFGDQVNLFTRYSIDSRWYRPLLWGIVGRLKISAGFIKDWDAEHPVPISELYRVGGINSVRGYDFYSISPTVPVGVNRGDAELFPFRVGGNKELVINSELEFPIFEKVGIRGVAFFDMGNAFAPGKFEDPAVPYSLYKSVGFGVRWFSPIGPLRFEWGIPLNRRLDPIEGIYLDRPIDFQFTIGNFF
jgi:outer membrane protein insertion porin family